MPIYQVSGELFHLQQYYNIIAGSPASMHTQAGSRPTVSPLDPLRYPLLARFGGHLKQTIVGCQLSKFTI